jgi:hypothetical protein
MMMNSTVITVMNPFNPHANKQVAHHHTPQKLVDLQPATELPFICVLNGQPLLKNEYTYTLKNNDVVVFITLPQGGGGSNPLRIVLMVALSIAAPYAAVGLLGSAAGTVGALTTLGSLVSGAIGFLGNALINVALGSNNQPSSIKQQNAIAASPTYNLTAQGNRIRPGEVIPDCYGRHLQFPDFCADPYTEYAGNEQYLYQQFCLGQGEYEIEEIRIGETPISSFQEIETEIVAPYQRGTLFPSLVETSGEVAGQEALKDVALGPFPVSSAGETATAVAFDVVCGRGLFYANDEGGLDALSVRFKFEIRPIDNMGTPTGAGTWTELETLTIRAASATPIRNSYRYSVTEARYEARMTRLDTKSTSSRAGHEIVWAALRGYTRAPQDYGNVTILNMRARATNNLSAQSSRQINVIKTRKLPIWDGEVWSEPTSTRNPAWAAVNILHADYAGRLPYSRIDLESFLARAETWDARGDKFDGLFDGQQVLFEMVNTVARAGRAKVYQQGGIWYCWRDEQQTLPVALFNMRNIARNSMRTQFFLPDQTNADAVEITYLDETTWSEQIVTAALPDSPQLSLVKEKLFGVTNRAQAWREGMHMVAQNRYRRSPATFTTEMEGFIPTFGDMISIAHDRARWGQSGDLLAYNAGTLTITTSEALDFSAGGTHYFRFRKADGSYDGPYTATEGEDEYHAVLDDALEFTPYLTTERERTSYSFGPGEEHGRTALVVGVRPRGLYQVEIQTINEDPAVHTADTGSNPPVSNQWNLPAQIRRPVVASLLVTLGGTASAPLLLISWPAAAGAFSYLVEVSYDGAVSWVRMAEPTVSQAAVPARRGIVNVRVAGLGLARGDWAEYVGNPFLAAPPDVATLLVSRQSDGTRQLDWTLPAAPPPDLSGYKIRYRVGTDAGWDWDDLDPLHEGLLTASPYETNQLDAGEYTFAIKAVDDSSIESENATFIIADLGDQRLAGVLVSVLPHTQGWPGTKTDCHLEGTALIANDTEIWSDKTSWSSWTRWNQTPEDPIVYEHSVIDVGGVLPFTPIVDIICVGTATVEESHSNDNISYSSFAAVGSLITARYIKVRASVTSGDIARINLINIKLAAESISEEINDLDISTLAGAFRIGTGDIRLPISKPYQVISQVQVTLQNVGAGWSWELIDKDISTGPRIKVYNASNALADASIDAFIRGA